MADAHPRPDGGRVADRAAALNNVARTAIEALAGVLGGTQSLHTNSYDEALALPTEEAVRVALRTQQIIAHETGVTNTIDPLGGSYFVESLTDQLEALAYAYFAKIDELGGMIEAVKRGFPQREIADAAYTLQLDTTAATVLVGVNDSPRAARASSSSIASTPRWSASRSTGCRGSGPAATRPRSTRPHRPARGGRRGRQPDGEPSRPRPRTRHRGRDRREPSPGLRDLHRNTRLLGAENTCAS